MGMCFTEEARPKAMDEKYLAATVCEAHTVNGPEFIPNSDPAMKAFIIRPKNSEGTKLPCMVYYHGGGAVAGSAEDGYNNIMARYAHDYNMIVFNVDYRLAPEAPAPGGINDGYAGLKYLLKNADKLGVDSSRVFIAGESGGGYITAGVSMRLAERNESHLVKFQAQLSAMVSDCYIHNRDKLEKWEIDAGPEAI